MGLGGAWLCGADIDHDTDGLENTLKGKKKVDTAFMHLEKVYDRGNKNMMCGENVSI